MTGHVTQGRCLKPPDPELRIEAKAQYPCSVAVSALMYCCPVSEKTQLSVDLSHCPVLLINRVFSFF